jgi:NADPH:quinone reductase-like Zn-dependent oxidoreductase
MKAVYIESYGGPETMRFGERPALLPGPGEVQVKIKAASINPIDWKMREGLLASFFKLPMPAILGRDMAGVVMAVGDGVTNFAPGDAVFGMGNQMRGGTHAEIAVTNEDLLAPMPRGLSAVEAASLGLIGASSLIPLEQTAQLKAGERVLIHGGSGGVGAFSIQLAKDLGAWVATTCGTTNVDYVRSLGADQVIDYAKEDFAQVLQDIDVVFDTMGGNIHRRSWSVMKPGGRLVMLAADPLPAEAPPPGINVLRCTIRANRPILDRIIDLAERGAVKPHIGKVLPLAEGIRGYALMQAATTRGKIVLEVSD